MKDNFSAQAALYSKYRPQYPRELFDFILSHVKNRHAAWDCGTGNGQTAMILAKSFQKVCATDISKKQLDQAPKNVGILYSLQKAEETDFKSNLFDLITVSQALHWFDFDRFYVEVRRVATKNALLAVWSYSLLSIDNEIDQIIIEKLYRNILGSYWDQERKLVDEEYKTIPFPFAEIASPKFFMDYEWTLVELIGYLNTWSAVQKFIKQNGQNPIDEISIELKKSWRQERMKIRFPIHLRLGKIED